MAETARVRIALAGNPNSGKTTLFNALTGAHRKTGNYAGVTVEKREGSRVRGGREYLFTDLPGIYSLTAYSIDEVVARDFLLDEKPDLIVDVLDSSSLERHLYLCLQFQELGIPVVGALNMSDEAEAKGIRIDAAALGAVLGIPLVRTVGSRGKGIEELLDAVDAMVPPGADRRAAADGSLPGVGDAGTRGDGAVPRRITYGEEVEGRLEALERAIRTDPGFADATPPRWLAVKLLERDRSAAARLEGHAAAPAIAPMAEAAAAWVEGHFGKPVDAVMSEQRYGYIRGALKEAVRAAPAKGGNLTERIDRAAMNPLLALPIFFLVLWGVFQLTFGLGAYPSAWIEAGFSALASLSGGIGDPLLRSFVMDGAIAGVGGVLGFVPYIVILFLLLSLLEDTGYMARAAFATDRFLHAFGLHGQSVLPMVLGFGCSVPAIMAARTLKSPRDRVVTILAIPFMSCGAKLPVHILLAGALFPGNAANMVMLIYACGVALALLSSLLLKRTVLKGEPTPFVMELPPYRLPTMRGVLWHVWSKTWGYVRKAGTVILAASALVWALTSFPDNGAADPGAKLEGSVAGAVGKAVQPLFAPIGLDWKMTVATITGFAAKETVVSTLAVLHGAGEADGARGLGAAVAAGAPAGPLARFGIMLFMLVIPPCFAALAAMRAEAGLKWLLFAVVYLFGLGWILAFALTSIGTLIYTA